MNLQPHLIHLVEEGDDLFIKIVKLEEFINSPPSYRISYEELELLKKQLEIMYQYLGVISKRMRLLSKPK